MLLVTAVARPTLSAGLRAIQLRAFILFLKADIVKNYLSFTKAKAEKYFYVNGCWRKLLTGG